MTRRAAALIVLSLLLMSPVSADAGGSILTIERHSKTISIAPNSFGSVSVNCPNDAPVSGGGFSIEGYPGVPGTRILASKPFDDGDAGRIPEDGWRVVGANDTDQSKELSAWAVCAANAGSRLSYRSVSLPAPPREDDPFTPTITEGIVLCNGTDRVIGGGASIKGRNLHRLHIGVTAPIDWSDGDATPDDGWRAKMSNTTKDATKLTVFAVCDPVDLYTYETVTAPVPTPGGGTFTKACTVGGHSVMGGGIEHGGDVSSIISGISAPLADEPAQSWSGSVYNFSAAMINLTTTVICLQP